jgi:hypothetical protein
MANKEFMDNFNRFRAPKVPLTFPLDSTRISDDYEITGTAPSFIASLILFYFSAKIWTWYIGLITDGYWMTLLSPLILIYWCLASIIFLPILCILIIFFIISCVWCIVFEIPASIMNKESLSFFTDAPDDTLTASVITVVLTIPLIGGFILAIVL